MTAMLLEIPASIGVIDDQKFEDLCKRNPDARIERTGKGDILIMPPTGGETGRRNAKLTGLFVAWNAKKNLGHVFDSSTAFKLPNNAILSPDLAFVFHSKWNALTLEERKKFPPICPDFVVEILSESDSIYLIQQKMQEWIANGVKLAWLLDLDSETAHIYKPEREIKELKGLDQVLTGEDILPDLQISLKELCE